ncbi:MAG: phosphoribosylformylglycinamidine synthase subunit PurQ [Spirochaetales bacterium]|nr:phosphoribosylformylglycinamidine synthase subunit PurQ [Spirochaetales bacterium]
MTAATCIITGFGINADDELKEAFDRAGSLSRKVHINDLIKNPHILDGFSILAFPGGFSFGDHLGSGKVFASLFKKRLKERLDRFIASGKLVIGICNGFQVLVKMGFLPNLSGTWKQEVSLIHNDSGVFEDRWVNLAFAEDSPCIWTRGLEKMEMPVRHGEGKFIIGNKETERIMREEKLIAATYTLKNPAEQAHDDDVPYPDNPNGSVDNIAGICDRTGHVFGLMPHPEAFIFPENHPRWKREKTRNGEGLKLFQNGVRYIKG